MAHAEGHSWLNLIIVLTLCLGSLTYGYVFSVISTTLGQPNFYAYFDLTTNPKEDAYNYTLSITAAMNGLLSAGGVAGALIMGWLCDAHGRKKGLGISSVVSIIGGALQAGSIHIGMLLIARFVTGIGVGMLVTLIPVFQSEIAPPATRGFLVGQHGFILVVGYALSSWVGYGSFFAKNAQFQWRFPLALQTLFPLILTVVVPWIPESPRWLLTKDRREEAWAIIAKLHAHADDANDHFAKEEFDQISHQVVSDRATYGDVTVLDLFRKPNYRKRMVCGGLTMFALQTSGNLVIYNYSVSLYQRLGFSNETSLLISAIYPTYGAFLNFVCSLLLDRFGRVRLFIIGFTACIVGLSGEAAMTAQFANSTNAAGLRAGVFFLFFYLTFFASCIDPNCYVYCAEIFPTHIRPQGMAFSISCFFLSTIPYLVGAPSAFAHIGWKFYLIFIILTAVNIVIIWNYFPETKGLSLEEINGVFGDEVAFPLHHSTDEEKPHVEGRDSANATSEDTGSQEVIKTEAKAVIVEHVN